MKKVWIILLVVGILGIGLISWYIKGLNYVVSLDEQVKAAWAQVENQLQRRNDLIPNLVNTVKGYAQHERELFTQITELRSQWAKAQTIQEKIENSKAMGSALSRLMVVVENYPDLKANQNFLALQAQLEGTENRIAVERMRYNEAVRTFNTYIRSVFGSFFAKRRNLDKPAVYFEVETEARRVPKVEF
ncbi:MAG: LemA family protein [Candidatus Omnitrophica bacterium]|nr:LemA family protein [Candidatus Omnitrophota bacterium]